MVSISFQDDIMPLLDKFAEEKTRGNRSSALDMILRSYFKDEHDFMEISSQENQSEIMNRLQKLEEQLAIHIQETENAIETKRIEKGLSQDHIQQLRLKHRDNSESGINDTITLPDDGLEIDPKDVRPTGFEKLDKKDSRDKNDLRETEEEK